jgi:opacity protein-like surface antigen
MRVKRKIAVAVMISACTPAFAQSSDWAYTASVSGWFTGLESSVETSFGTVETELDFADVLDSLDLAFFGSFEARNGRWALVTDLIFADLGTDVSAPFGDAFRRADVDTQNTLFSAYAAYAVVERPGLRVEVGPGFRYNEASIDVRLVGNVAPTRTVSFSDSWVDPLLGARMRFDLSENWFGSAFADIGGFGMEDASDTTWQAYAGLGYRFNETWAVQAGYRQLSIERAFGGRDVTLDLSGPMIGVQASF